MRIDCIPDNLGSRLLILIILERMMYFDVDLCQRVEVPDVKKEARWWKFFVVRICF